MDNGDSQSISTLRRSLLSTAFHTNHNHLELKETYMPCLIILGIKTCDHTICSATDAWMYVYYNQYRAINYLPAEMVAINPVD